MPAKIAVINCCKTQILFVCMHRKLSEQEAREKANADQLVNTDVRTKEFEAMVYLYKYETS